MNAAQMAAEVKISFEINFLISGNQREYLRKSAGKKKENLPQMSAAQMAAEGKLALK